MESRRDDVGCKKDSHSAHHRPVPRSAQPMGGWPDKRPRSSCISLSFPALDHSCIWLQSVSRGCGLLIQLQCSSSTTGFRIMESAIRWSPSSTSAEQRFLSVDVIGKSFRLCKVTGFNGRHLRHEVLSTLTDVPLFRAFDWSTSNENLIAVGQSSGEATILRLDANAKESLSFPVRNQRYCNAIAFSSHGLVASGLDRVRNDFCLNIWDVNQRLSSASGSKSFPEPLRKLASSEPITSIKFFRDQPDTVVTGVKGQFVRIYDLRGLYSLSLECFEDR